MARGDSEWRGIRTRQYTFVKSASDNGYLLYDNINDPFQQHNLIDEAAYEATLSNLREQLDNVVSGHDKLLPWEDFIIEFGLKDE